MIYRPVKELDLPHADIYIDGVHAGTGEIEFADGYAHITIAPGVFKLIRCTASVQESGPGEGPWIVQLFRLPADS